MTIYTTLRISEEFNREKRQRTRKKAKSQQRLGRNRDQAAKAPLFSRFSRISR
jgi:hypothetical protein